MNYIQITKNDIANGTGVRTVLWVSGCSHHCDECHNPQTWNPNAGKPFDQNALNSLLETLSKPYIEGITFSGGDPLYDKNVKDISNIIKCIKKEYPNKNIWLYTGYTIEDIFSSDTEEAILRQQIILNCDVLVDGRYDKQKRNISLPWCGSSNQRVINIPKTVKEQKIVLYK